MSVIVDVVSGVLLLTGALLALLGALGVVRLRDPLVAMHAATKPATLGVVLTGVGVILQLGNAGSISKVAVVVVVQLATVPVGAHMLGRAMERSGRD